MSTVLGDELRHGNETSKCETSVRVYVIIMTIYRVLEFFSPFLCMIIVVTQLKDERNRDSRVHFTPLV
jgi:hypothetical protein